MKFWALTLLITVSFLSYGAAQERFVSVPDSALKVPPPPPGPLKRDRGYDDLTMINPRLMGGGGGEEEDVEGDSVRAMARRCWLSMSRHAASAMEMRSRPDPIVVGRSSGGRLASPQPGDPQSPPGSPVSIGAYSSSSDDEEGTPKRNKRSCDLFAPCRKALEKKRKKD